MLAVPLKKGKSVDWSGPLRSYMSSHYSPAQVDEQQASFQKINSARDRLLGLKRGDAQSIELAKSYLRMLGSIEARFPVSENEINLNFTWYDSLKPTKKFTHHRIGAERACVLFNYAALESSAGMTTDRGNVEGLKAACAHFQTAASVFTFLKDEYVNQRVSGPVTSDLSHDGLSMLANLMLAQAQACFFEKAITDKYRPTVLSMLGAQARVFYEAALKSAQAPGVKEVLDKSWAAHFQFQAHCFAASSEFQYSKVVFQEAEKTGEGYGLRLAWLASAVQKCQQAIDHARAAGLPEGMLTTVENLRSILEKEQRKATEDNNAIYMDRVPPQNELTPINAKALAKVSSVPEDLWKPILPGQSGDGVIFEGLAPAKMQNAEKMFKDRLNAIINSTQGTVVNTEKAVRTRLTELNLPAAVEAGDMSSRGVPDQTWARVLSLVQQKGGVAALKISIQQNAAVANEITNSIASTNAKLKEEEQSDARSRQTWGDNWQLQPAMDAHVNFNKDTARFQGLLAEAKASDNTLLQKIESKATLLDTVSMPKQQMDLLIPDPSQVDDDPKVEALRSGLATLLVEVESSMVQMKSAFEGLQMDAAGDSIVKELSKQDDWRNVVENPDLIEPAINQALQKYEERVDEVNRLAENMTVSLLARIMEKNHAFMASRRENAATSKREEAIQNIEDGIAAYEKLTRHVQDGKEFYANLRNLVINLGTTVSDHILSRQMMAREMEENNVRAVQSGQGFGTSTAPEVSAYSAGQSFGGSVSQSPPSYGAAQSMSSNVNGMPSAAAQPFDFGSGASAFQPAPAANSAATANAFSQPAASTPPAGGAGVDADAAVLQAEVLRQQQEILDNLRTGQQMEQLNSRHYDAEVAQIKAIMPKQKKADIEAALKATDGNVEVAMNHLLNGTKPAKARTNLFGRKNKSKPAW